MLQYVINGINKSSVIQPEKLFFLKVSMGCSRDYCIWKNYGECHFTVDYCAGAG